MRNETKKKGSFLFTTAMALVVFILLFTSLWLVFGMGSPFLAFKNKAPFSAFLNKSERYNNAFPLPEYDLRLKKMVISLSERESTLSFHHKILLSLPQYTEIILLVPKDNLDRLKPFLIKQPYANRIQIVPYKTAVSTKGFYYLVFPENEKLIEVDPGNKQINQGTIWAQDLFEIMFMPDGRNLAVISNVHKWFKGVGEAGSRKAVSDNNYLVCLKETGLEVAATPLTFSGGNIMFDVFMDERLAFCGVNVILTTQTTLKSTVGIMPEKGEIIEFIKDVFNTDEVVIIGRSLQPPSLMFHLDQAMILLPGGIAAVTHIVGRLSDSTESEINELKKVKFFLKELRQTLINRGYKVVDIDTSADNISNHQYYVNALPYVHAETGERTLFMPVFTKADTAFDAILVKKNKALFESLGYSVETIPVTVDTINGGLHCLVNVIE